MKEKPYMSSADLLEWLKVGALAGEAKFAAEETKKHAKTPKEKDWAKRMAIAATHLGKVTDERLECMDTEQVLTVQRRHRNTSIRLYTSDQMRLEDKNPKRENVTICYDDWCLLGELALMHCDICPQGKYVKDCEYRKMFHRVGIPVGREDVKEGQCEFRYCDYIHVILPQGGEDKANLVRQEVQKIYQDAEKARATIKEKLEKDKREFL